MAGTIAGVHIGTIVNNVDPTGKGRAMVRIPAIAGAASMWAPVCRPFAATAGAPAIGGRAVVAFEGGDPDRPIILGMIPA